MTRTLVVTNDFPPRPGGIQAFVHSLASRLPPDDVVVYAPAWRGAADFDAAQRFPVVRHPTSLMLPVPGVLSRARDIARAEGCDVVWFGAAAPLALLGSALRRETSIRRAVASTHGHEVGWAMLPGARQTLRAIGQRVDVVTYLGEYTRSRLGARLWAASAPGSAYPAAWTPTSSDPAPETAPCAAATGWRIDRSWFACPDSCHARGRTS